MPRTRNKKWIVRPSTFLTAIATVQGAVELGIDRLAADDHEVCGGTFIHSQVEAGKSPRQIIAGWQPNEQEFRRQRTPYLLY